MICHDGIYFLCRSAFSLRFLCFERWCFAFPLDQWLLEGFGTSSPANAQVGGCGTGHEFPALQMGFQQNWRAPKPFKLAIFRTEPHGLFFFESQSVRNIMTYHQNHQTSENPDVSRWFFFKVISIGPFSQSQGLAGW